MKPFLAIFAFAFAIVLPTQALAQVSLPSKEEILELASKADQKVSGFEEALKNAKPLLDTIDSKLPKTYQDAASAAHTIIQGIQKNGPSAYGLVGLLATLDDLSLNAAKAGLQLLATDEENVTKGNRPDFGVLAAVSQLNNSGTACNDIAELILHATLRYIRAEEQVLEKALGDGK